MRALINTIGHRTAVRILPAFGLLALAACSSFVEGTDQSVTVITNPSGATCTLEREGATIGAVNPTPGTVNVVKSKHSIVISCIRPGHETSVGTLVSSFEEMTFGNLLFGGLVGLAIDASSGAINNYPPSILITMTPSSFPTEAARDAFYAERKAQAASKAAAAIARVASRCDTPESSQCKGDIAVIESSRDAEQADLEAKRLRARVDGS